MKKLVLGGLLLLFTSTNISGQNVAPKIEPETWANNPKITLLDNKYAKDPAVVILDKRRVEFIDEGKDEINEYVTLHKIIHINDDRGIESLNKIYLGISEKSDIVEIKARTILANGKVVELDKNYIKDVQEEDGNTYKIFAMEGLEKGCDMEYYYTFKRSASFFGREVVQSVYPQIQTKFELIGPQRLKFDVKTYNFSTPIIDTVLNDKRIKQFTYNGTPGADEEKYANYHANLQRIEYKLSYNTSNPDAGRLYTWDQLANRIYSIYIVTTEKEKAQVSDLVTANGWDKLPNEVSKIVTVENYIKTKFAYNENLSSEDANSLDQVLNNKVGGTIGTLHLYAAIFEKLDIKFQFVFTGDRDKYLIDKDFENWNNCENPLFYFPNENKFLTPTRPDFRYPWIIPSWGGTTGLFCKPIPIGSKTTQIAEIRNIDLEPYNSSRQDIDSKIEFSQNLDSLVIDARHIFKGYPAVSFRYAANFANEEQKTNIIKEFAKSYSSSENIVFSEILNPEFDKSSSNEPIIMHIKTKSGELIEQAGNKLLFKIGMVIGPQVEMYQEKKRQEPIDMDFPHVEERKIELVIPKGYKISNLNDLKIDQTYAENGHITMGFVSDYQLKGNILTVHIMEQYCNVFYPITQFEQFKKIINASSDFNKVVLILEKKQG